MKTSRMPLIIFNLWNCDIATTAKYAHVMDEHLLAGMEAAAQKRRGKSQQNPSRRKTQ
jgi:hypothetical protein